MDGMKTLFEEHYVSMPEEKYDVLESMVQKLDDMETKLNEQIERNIALNGKPPRVLLTEFSVKLLKVSQSPKRISLQPSQKVLSLRVKRTIERN